MHTDGAMELLNIPDGPPETLLGRQVLATLDAMGVYAVDGSLSEPYLAHCQLFTPAGCSYMNGHPQPDEIDAARRDYTAIYEFMQELVGARFAGVRVTASFREPGELEPRVPRVTDPHQWPADPGEVGTVTFYIETW